MAAAADVHPPKEQLVAFGLGKLEPNQATQIEQHLEGCPDCCETILDLADDTFVGLVRKCDAAVAQSDLSGATIEASSGSQPALHTPTELPPALKAHDRYEIQELIGRGGMGDVYKAQHKVMNRVVALKVIKPQLVKNEAAVQRFRREVQAAASLHHKHIVTAYDAEQAGELHFLVMEFVPGVNLDEVIRQRGPLPVAEACNYIRQAAEGLQHAHELGMVHRDIKPHNLMVTQSGEVKILDFGLAGFATEVAEEEIRAEASQPAAETAAALHQLTQMGTMMGTPDYIAPEQAENAHAADIRADIYSLGCTFYTLLAGKPPFGEGSVLDKIKAHSEQPPPPLSGHRHDVPAEVQAILQKMMAKDAARRYQTPAEVAAALEKVAVSWQPSVATQPARSLRRPLALTAVGTILTAIAAGVIIYLATDTGRLEINSDAAIPGAKIVLFKNGREYAAFDVESVPQHQTIRAGEYEISLRGAPPGVDLDVWSTKKGKPHDFGAPYNPHNKTVVVYRGGGMIIEIEKPSPAKARPRAPSQALPLVIGMNEGVPMFDGRLVPPHELSDLLIEALAENPDREVVIDLPKQPWTVVEHVDQFEQIARTAGAKHVTRPAWARVSLPDKPSKFLERLAGANVIEQLVREQGGQADPPVTDVRIAKLTRPIPAEVEFSAHVAGRDGAASALLEKLEEALPRIAEETNATIEHVGRHAEDNVEERFLSFRTDERMGLVHARINGIGLAGWILRIKLADWPRNQRPSKQHATLIVFGIANMISGGNDQTFVSIEAPGYTVGAVFLMQRLPSGEFVDSEFLETQLRLAIEKNPGLPVVLDVRDEVDSSDPRIAAHIERVRRIVEAAGAFVRTGPGVSRTAVNGFSYDWVSLFNGRDLSGWQTHASQPDGWRVQDGVLIGDGGEPGHLFSEKGDYENFHLRAEVKINDHGNGGIYFRAQQDVSEKKNFPSGYEAQVLCGTYISAAGRHEPQMTGSLYNFVRVEKQIVSPEEWFTLEVIAHDNHLVIKVNGETTADYVDEARTWQRGHIALQQMPPGRGREPTVIQFRKIEILELDKNGQPRRSVEPLRVVPHGRSISGFLWLPDGTMVVSSFDSDAEAWNLSFYDEGKDAPEAALAGKDGVSHLAASADGKWIAAGSREGHSATLWDAEQRKPVKTFDAGGMVHGVSVSPDGKLLAAASWDGLVRVWSIESHELVKELPGRVRMHRVLFSPNGKTLAVSDTPEGRIDFWDTDSWTRRATSVHGYGVGQMAFTPDSTMLVTGGSGLKNSEPEKMSIKVWDAATGRQLVRFDEMKNAVEAVAVSPDSRYLIAVGGNWGDDPRWGGEPHEAEPIRVWDIVSKRLVAELDGHDQWVRGIAFSPDGQRFATVNKEIKVWQLSQSVWPKAAEQDASLTEERVKELVSEAAGIPNDDWVKLASGTEAPSPDTLESQTLSLMLFSLRALPPAGIESELPAIANLKKDFQYLPEHTPKPAEIARALWISRTKGYASYIQPEYVTEVTVNVTGDTASGEVAFEKEELYRGRVRYVARRANGDWRIEEFHLPNVGLSLQLSEPGVWKRLIRAQSGDDSP